ncbi:hypothetical protein MNBD_UNCLBAC01-1826 [hydrothermal vent metagenome]|uniref:VanZ-like domain-containing protein n=1 Tax=hydrothermal vent metagenome TaxID=652676 RepID=A0A3B1DLI8_9ZZZZ
MLSPAVKVKKFVLQRHKFLYVWFPVVFYSGIIFYVSSLSTISVPLSGFNFDKAVHIVEYLPFGFLLARALQHTNTNLSGKNLVGLVMVLSLVYGLSDEFHQSFVPGRQAGLLDVLADTIGGWLGGWFYIKVKVIK